MAPISIVDHAAQVAEEVERLNGRLRAKGVRAFGAFRSPVV
ncbi:MAG TPA: hypothetical protein VMY37_12245 [Thermoguttaceae bacterium]|nr:hypothetical protein [Thermoguttaceae bacterium]